ncbi:MAG TPA: response regulator transcription factor [Roseiflexaceae bacterium]|nr:response regulator transcription factor [Roseiflexaceae bacterium]
MNVLRLVLVDDHQVVRLGLRALLEREPDITVVGEAGTAAEAIETVGRLQPDLVLMDIRLPDQSGIVACQQVRQRWPAMQVLMLTSFADEDLVLEAISAGAAGYVLKQVGNDDLLSAVRAVGRGDAVLDPAVTRQLLARVRRAEHDAHGAAFHDLSERELAVLAHVAEGKTNAEIAGALVLSEKTVRNHVSTILEKLQLTNRIEAATYAVRHHIERFLPER